MNYGVPGPEEEEGQGGEGKRSVGTEHNTDPLKEHQLYGGGFWCPFRERDLKKEKKNGINPLWAMMDLV